MPSNDPLHSQNAFALNVSTVKLVGLGIWYTWMQVCCGVIKGTRSSESCLCAKKQGHDRQALSLNCRFDLISSQFHRCSYFLLNSSCASTIYWPCGCTCRRLYPAFPFVLDCFAYFLGRAAPPTRICMPHVPGVLFMVDIGKMVEAPTRCMSLIDNPLKPLPVDDRIFGEVLRGHPKPAM